MTTVGNNVARVWNTADWSLAAEIKGLGLVCGATFSPDGASLLVTSCGDRCSFFRRIPWKDGRVVHEFGRQEWGATRGEISADGAVMATGSYYGNCQHVWDVAQGKLLRSYSSNDVADGGDLCLHPGGKLLLRNAVGGEWIAESLPDEKILRRNLGFVPAAFAPDGSLLFAFADAPPVSRRVNGQLGQPTAAVRIQVRAPTDDFRLIASSPDATHAYAAVVSGNGKRMAALSFRDGLPKGHDERRDTVEVYSLPDLRRTAICELPPGGRIRACAISPDGRVVAIDCTGGSPRLFDAATGQPIRVGNAHQGMVKQIAFGADGKTLRSFDDLFVCTWDAATMRLLSRVAGPADSAFVMARPGDGAFAAYRTHGTTRHVARIVDVSAGKVACEVELPEGWMDRWKEGRLYWLNNHEMLCCGDRQWLRFDYQSGKAIAHGESGHNTPRLLCRGAGEPTEDGKSLLLVAGDKRRRLLNAERLDLVAMRSARWGTIQPERWPNGEFGLIPGGKYFHVGTQIYDRGTLKLIGEKDLGAVENVDVTVSPDGSRLAIVTGVPAGDVSAYQLWDPKNHSIVRVLEVPSCKTVFAFRASTQWVRQFAFSPDSSRLAVVNDDNAIEVRMLASVRDPENK